METRALRLLIRQKLNDARLPFNSIPRVWGGPGAGEICDACDDPVVKPDLVIEGVSIDFHKRAVQFHVECFYLWDYERRAGE